MLGKANGSNPIGANDQKGDDDMDKGDPVGEVGSIHDMEEKVGEETSTIGHGYS